MHFQSFNSTINKSNAAKFDDWNFIGGTIGRLGGVELEASTV